MPALSNPRHEAFTQAIFAGLTGKTRIDRAQSTAYLKAYPNCSSGNSAEACASRLLRNAKPILDRVRELVAEANKRLQPAIDLSRQRIGRDLDHAAQMAKAQGNANALVSSALGIAKVFPSVPNDQNNPLDFKQAKFMHDIASQPSQAQINLAIEANNAFAHLDAMTKSPSHHAAPA